MRNGVIFQLLLLVVIHYNNHSDCYDDVMSNKKTFSNNFDVCVICNSIANRSTSVSKVIISQTVTTSIMNLSSFVSKQSNLQKRITLS